VLSFYLACLSIGVTPHLPSLPNRTATILMFFQVTLKVPSFIAGSGPAYFWISSRTLSDKWIKFFTGQTSFLSPLQQCQSSEAPTFT